MTDGVILIVDDNPLNVELLSFLLTSQGYEMHTAADAADAQALLETLRPRVILMDIRLPGLDGFELTRILKADPRTSAIPIIAVTASAMKGDEERARAAGCDGYITKPIDTRSFPAQLAALIERG